MIETFIGSLANGFIIIINLMDFATIVCLSSCEIIILCLGLSNFVFLWILSITYMVYFLFTDLAILYLSSLRYPFLFFSNLSLWCASWSSVFYFVHITNINCFLTRHFVNCLPVRLFSSVAMSILFSLPFLYNSLDTFNGHVNGLGNFSSHPFFNTAFIPMSLLGSILPFIAFSRPALWII
ncbi:hypothetical protein GDO86_013528 [Hymenochirus boettgeri]|uniref:Uncharacterized protein n=1 Tax=Hymenochirus boettgeri TaxID=247094 RepID=A0A8T2IZP8_9PIPI|nr:hypothetical protein GDO86_013528 [Hymenochirus boettgeri]